MKTLTAGLIVSIQPNRGGPFDAVEYVRAYALAAHLGGAVGLRLEGRRDLKAVKGLTPLPIIGLIKLPEPGHDIIITSSIDDVNDIADAGADIIAFDATERLRPTAVKDLITAVHARGCRAMADIATPKEGKKAHDLGADLIASTLSGYTDDSHKHDGPDLVLVQELAGFCNRAVAEGRIWTPEQAVQALHAGAFAVTVGTAITRPELLVARFAEAIAQGAAGGG